MHHRLRDLDKRAVALAIVGPLLLLAVVLSSQRSLWPLTMEDGPVETLSALFWLGAFAFCIFRIVSRRGTVLLFFWAVFCLLCLGEETSWFQRGLGFATPDYVEARNVQGEFNFHNLAVLNPERHSWYNAVLSGEVSFALLLNADKAFALGFVVYFLLIPLLARRKTLLRWLARLGYSPPRVEFLVVVWMTLVLSYAAIFFLDDVSHRHSLREVREMLYALFVFLYVWGHLPARMKATSSDTDTPPIDAKKLCLEAAR